MPVTMLQVAASVVELDEATGDLLQVPRLEPAPVVVGALAPDGRLRWGAKMCNIIGNIFGQYLKKC